MKKLTSKQNKFVNEYINTLNPELSAKKAGFNVKDYKAYGEKLLSLPHIVKSINILIKKHINTLQVQRSYVIQKLLDIAEFSLEEEEIYDKFNSYTGKRKLRDAASGLKALECLCKYLGFSTKDSTLENLPKIITIKNLDDEKI